MNRSKTLTLAPAAQAMLSAVTAFALHRTNFDAAPPRLGLQNSTDGNLEDAGGEGKKPDVGTVVAKGEIIGDGTGEGSIVQTQQQAAAPDAAAPGTVLSAKDDPAALDSEGKAAIGAPAGTETQQS